MPHLDLLQEAGIPLDVSSDIFDFRPRLFTPEDCERYLSVFIETVPWSQTRQRMYGKEVITPRLTAWFGDPGTDYGTEGSGMPTFPWTPELSEIKTRVEKVSGIVFNSVLLNFYRNGNDSVTWHSDRDGVPGRNQYVASVSFGQARPFDLRKKGDPAQKFTVNLENGTYLLMKGEFQDQWEHRIAKSRVSMGPRVNLTFRISRRI